MDLKKHQWYAAMFEHQFMLKRGNAFQTFFNDIMSVRYPADFMPTRPWGNEGDRKCDGYLQTQRQLFQVYAPEKPLDRSETTQKMDVDFHGALPHWRSYFDTWTFVHNTHPKSGLPTFVVEKLILFETNNSPIKCNHWGCTELREQLLCLPENKVITVLPDYPSDLNIANLQFEDVQDVLDDIQVQSEIESCDLSDASSKKLDYNELGSCPRALFQLGLRKTKLVKRYFTGRVWDPQYGDRIASAFTKRYLELKGEGLAPDDIYWQLQIFAGGDHLLSPRRTSAVTAVLAYLFESCDIFERVPVT